MINLSWMLGFICLIQVRITVEVSTCKLLKTNACDLPLCETIILWGTTVAPGGSKLHRIVISAIESAIEAVLSFYCFIYIVSTYSYIYLNIYKSMPVYLHLHLHSAVYRYIYEYKSIHARSRQASPKYTDSQFVICMAVPYSITPYFMGNCIQMYPWCTHDVP